MPAEVAFINGNVLTIDPHQPRATAVATLHDRILAVGSDDEVRVEIGKQTQVIDLDGRTVLPGLNDNHGHPMGYGFALGWIDASSSAVRTLAELQKRFRQALESTPANGWLRARGYDDTRLDIGRHPSRWDLDPVSGGRPALLTRTCGHMAVANSKALEIAGIRRETPDPEGGQIVRDEHGEPTGLLLELAQDLVRQHLPPTTTADIKDALARAGQEYLSLGITSVGEAGISHSSELEAYQDLRSNGELPVRTFLMMMIDDTLESLAQLGIRTGFGDEWLRIGPAKLFQDGSGGGRTAAMYRAYPGEPDNFGITIYTQEQLDEAFTRVAAAGFQGTAHAIGDKAIDMIITAYERALAAHPQVDPRWRIEHAGLMTPRLLARMKALNLIAVPQPSFIYFLGDSYIKNFSEDALDLSYPSRSFFDLGIIAIGSSDVPVVPADPWINIRSAVTRLTQDGQVMGPDEGVSVDQALQMFTINGAYGTFEEQVKGSLTPGKLADLIVVDQDPHRIDPDKLHTIKNQLTMIGGRIVYEA